MEGGGEGRNPKINYLMFGGGGRGVFQKLINTGATKAQKILNKTSKFGPNVSKILIASAFQNWHKMRFLLHFHVCCFSINRYK